jgi:hypothetical protein
VLKIIRVRGEEVGVIAYHPTSKARRNWLDQSDEIKQKSLFPLNSTATTVRSLTSNMSSNWSNIGFLLFVHSSFVGGALSPFGHKALFSFRSRSVLNNTPSLPPTLSHHAQPI